jgi:hypothetical protein
MDIYLPFGHQNVRQHVFYPFNPIRPELMMLGGVTEPEPNVRLSKNDSKKIKIGQKSFFGRIFEFLGKSDTENSNFAKSLNLDHVYPRYGPSKLKKVQKCEKTDQKSKFDFFVFLAWKTRISTRF